MSVGEKICFLSFELISDYAINSKSPGFIFEEVTTVSTAYSSFNWNQFSNDVLLIRPCLRKESMKLVKILIFKNTTDNEYFQFHTVYMTRMEAQGNTSLKHR